MRLFKRIPDPVEAVQWHCMDDHPGVLPAVYAGTLGDQPCRRCGQSLRGHGEVATTGQLVCPSDWVVSLKYCGFVAIPAREFEMAFEPVTSGNNFDGTSGSKG